MKGIVTRWKKGPKELISKLAQKGVELEKFNALEMFGRNGTWHTSFFADKVKSIEIWEIDKKWEKKLEKNFPNSKIKNENYSISAISKDLNSFEKIYETIQLNKSQKSYRRSLEQNLKNDSTWFYLNKQAAFVEKIAICEEAEESPLGPIKVVLTSSNIDGIIDWIIFD